MSRDRILISTIVAIAILGGFWVGILGPKREEAGRLSEQLATQQDRLQKAQAGATEANAARARYNADYSVISLLGKAVPSTDGVASLLYQIDSAASGAKIDFQTFTSATGGSAGGAGGSAGASGSAAAPAQAPAAGASASASGAAAPAAGAAAAGPSPMPLTFAFEGSFADMQRLVDRLNRFVQINGEDVRVRGRLLSVSDISLSPSEGGTTVKATISAVAYTAPEPKGVTDTASPAQAGSGGTAAAPAAPTATANAAGANG